MSTATYPDERTQRMINVFRDASWRANYAGKMWPVRVLLAGDKLGGDAIAETTVVLFDDESKPAHRFNLEQAEAIAGLTKPDATNAFQRLRDARFRVFLDGVVYAARWMMPGDRIHGQIVAKESIALFHGATGAFFKLLSESEYLTTPVLPNQTNEDEWAAKIAL